MQIFNPAARLTGEELAAKIEQLENAIMVELNTIERRFREMTTPGTDVKAKAKEAYQHIDALRDLYREKIQTGREAIERINSMEN
jgi:hypothetical protein